jgi:hypothetical protein
VSCQLAGQSGDLSTRCASCAKRPSHGQRDSGRRSCCILIGTGALCLAVLPVRAQESSDIANQAQNPIANLISVPVENDFNPQTGIKKDDSYVMELKPVIPFRLSDTWTVITRTIIPVIQVPDLAPGIAETTGLGDVNVSLVLSPAKAGPIILGRWTDYFFSYSHSGRPGN